MPRSGTTLVEQILSSHPAVHGAGELDAPSQFVKDLEAIANGQEAFPSCLVAARTDDVTGLVKRYLDRLQQHDSDATRIVDKMPSNAFEVGLIRSLWPHARIVICSRDPLDICVSCFTRNFAHGHRFSWNLEDLGHYYTQYERIVAHWKEIVPDLYEVRYEQLIAGQERITREMVEFLGLEWTDECLEFHSVERRVKTNPYSVRRPIYGSSVGRWRHFEKFLGPLQEALREASVE